MLYVELWINKKSIRSIQSMIAIQIKCESCLSSTLNYWHTTEFLASAFSLRRKLLNANPWVVFNQYLHLTKKEKMWKFSAQILCIQPNIQSISTDNLSCFHRRRGGGGGCRLFCVLSLVFAQRSKAALGSSLNNLFTILIHLQFDNDNLSE